MASFFQAVVGDECDFPFPKVSLILLLFLLSCPVIPFLMKSFSFLLDHSTSTAMSTLAQDS